MFSAILSVENDDDYREAISAIYEFKFTDVLIITRSKPEDARNVIRILFSGAGTNKSDAQAYFAKRGVVANMEDVEQVI